MNSPFVMVIFGVTGDLAQHKLIPSLFYLFKRKLLPQEFFIVGFSRRDLNDDGLRAYFPKLMEQDSWIEFSKHLTYQQGTFEEKAGYLSLIEKLKKLDDKIGACITRFFYLATPPEKYTSILDFLNETKLSEGCGSASTYLASESATAQAKRASMGRHGGSQWTRIIVEKPFGKDLETARALDKKISEIFEERQIFRVDHYLGKETVQNILAFRFANGIFDPIWNKNYIDHVQITFAEKSGIGNRGKFFDGVGILRDVAQNHLMQLIAAVAMESPRGFTKEDVRNARATAIGAIECIEKENVPQFVVRARYEGYRDEKDVNPALNTETFISMKLFVNTPRFKNVPFYVRAGKKMPKNTVEISLVFRQTCHILFKEYGCPEIGNVLTIRIQPDEGISVRIIAKKPGTKLALETVNMDFTYEEAFQTKGIEAYEKILLDIFAGDQMLFNRSDELDHSWELVTKILDGWKSDKSEILSYEQGTWGPKEADDLMKRDGRSWLIF